MGGFTIEIEEGWSEENGVIVRNLSFSTPIEFERIHTLRANKLSYVELFAWQKARGGWKVFGRVIVATIQPRRDNLGRFRLEISRLDISGFPR